ncbi:MAG: DUF1189 domain-containing protein [Clostridia bacterium]|nr:DUF1189 domain-containing protein [Clostridia bacterium]
MENNNKLSFFARMISAITDFRIYPYIRREKVISSISYFLKLLLFITLIISIYVISNVYEIAEKFTADFNNEIPNFTLKDGVLEAETNTKYSIENGIIILDTNYTAEELKEASNTDIIGYNYNVLISKDAMNIYANENLLGAVDFDKIIGEYTKQGFYNNVLQHFNDIRIKIYLFATTYIAIFTAYILLKLTNILTAMILATIFNFLFGNSLKFGDIFKIAAYALTLPIIIETVALILIGNVSESVTLIYQLLVCVYVFYALRAIKLDKIIITATQNGILKKIVNNDGINIEAQNDLNEKEEVKENRDEENKED